MKSIFKAKILVSVAVAIFSFSMFTQYVSAQETMKIGYGWSIQDEESRAVAEAVKMMNESLDGVSPKLVIIFSTGGRYDQQVVFENLKQRLSPEAKIWGATSGEKGVFSKDGFHKGLAILGLAHPKLTAGVGICKYEDNKEVGKAAVLAAIKDAGKTPSEIPNLVLLSGPGLTSQLEVVKGMEEVVGKNVPIIGGSSGGKRPEPDPGFQFTTTGTSSKTVAVAVLYTNVKIGTAYGYGYEEIPAYKGVATKADFEKRIVYEIDGIPAAYIWDKWTGGKIRKYIDEGEGWIDMNVISRYCFKKPITKAKKGPYVLVGAVYVHKDKSLSVAHEGIEEGKELTLVKMSDKMVSHKPMAVARLARLTARIPERKVAGGFFLYCNAPFVTFEGDIGSVIPPLRKSFGDAPFIGFLAEGEHGYSARGGNRFMAYSTVVLLFGED